MAAPPVLAAPAVPPVRRLHDIVSRAIDPCAGARAEITVCGRRDGESPYRLPPEARDPGFRIDGPVDSVSRERHQLMDVGGAGALQNACSATGAAGWTGCTVTQWRQADEQRGFRRPR